MASSATQNFEKAQSLFQLKNPEPATDKEWETYIANRQGAAKFRPKTKLPLDSATQKDGDEDEDDEDEYDEVYGEDYVFEAIEANFAKLEKEMSLETGLLQSNFKILYCDAEYDDEEPRTVSTHTRIYSPTRPTYLDVHLQYHCRSRYESVEWMYKLGFKAYRRPATDDYRPSAIRKFEQGSFDSAYGSGGWHPISYGFFDDDIAWSGRHWKRAEQSAFKLDSEAIQDVYETLWGPLPEISEGRRGKHDEEKHRKKLVNTVQILLGAVGIKYGIACDDDGRDGGGWGGYALEGLSDRWFARETRKACGFQLKGDPEKEKEGHEEKEKNVEAW